MKIQEIASLTGVSIATVSRVFSNNPNIRPEVREHVLEVARKLGYKPRLSEKQKNIVIIIPYDQIYPAAEFVDMVISSLIHELAKEGFRIEMLPYDNMERLKEIPFRAAIGIGIDAPKDWDENFYQPLVIIDKIPEKKSPGVVYVHSNEKQGMDLTVEHLAKCGCRKIGAILHGIAGSGNVDLRSHGFLNALKKNHLPSSPQLVKVCEAGNFFEEMGKLLQQGIDGVFCGGGSNFGGLAAYCLSLYGKKIPDDIRLVCSERQRISRYCIPPQTAISQDYTEMATVTIRMINSLIQGERVPSETVLPYVLIKRDST